MMTLTVGWSLARAVAVLDPVDPLEEGRALPARADVVEAVAKG
jgi:hypothetical protein